MCHFVTIAAAPGSSAVLEGFLRENHFRILPNENASIAAALPVGSAAYLVVHGQCSCGLIPSEGGRNLSRELAKAETRYRRMGWGEAKLQRALAAKREGWQESRKCPEEARFRTMIASIARGLGWVDVVVHSYEGDTGSERITFGPRRSVSLSDHQGGNWQYPEDVVLRVLRPAG